MRRSSVIAAFSILSALSAACAVAPTAAPGVAPEQAGTPAGTKAPRPAQPGPVESTPRTNVGGIEITVYYTAVESFHTGSRQAVTGCLIRDCAFGRSDLGSYPSTFVRAVKTEGTGRITSGSFAGRYLNWSHDVGYWVDTIPSDAYGRALIPLSTAAADLDVLSPGTRFVLVPPLTLDNGEPADRSVEAWLSQGPWTINDQFTPGLGGAGHIDLYLGEEDRVNYPNTSPLYQTFINASISILG